MRRAPAPEPDGPAPATVCRQVGQEPWPDRGERWVRDAVQSSGRGQPVTVDTTQDDPAQDDPTQDDPTQDDPAQDDPAQDDPAQDDPAQDDPAQDDPRQDDLAAEAPPRRPVGSAAAAARSLVEQTVEELGGAGSLLARQRADHALLEQLLSEVRSTTGTTQDEALTRLGRLVFPHAYGEETVVWPVLRRVLPDGEQLTARNEQEHQEVNELWSELDRTPSGAPRRSELVERIAALLHQDARDEEDLILPRLQQALSVQELRRLGRTWQLVRWTAPTRPHAVVSRRPPGNVVAGLPLAVLDRSRDALDRGARATPVLAGPLGSGSRALAVLAGLLEHLPPLPHGERPTTHRRRTDAP